MATTPDGVSECGVALVFYQTYFDLEDDFRSLSLRGMVSIAGRVMMEKIRGKHVHRL